MTKAEVKKYRVEGPNGATVTVRVGGPRGMSERNWNLRTKSGELKVLEDLSPKKPTSKKNG